MGEQKHKAYWLRARVAHKHHKVSFVELFFDLVFVFALTQLSHRLLAHFTLLGALETAILLLAVWWVWVYTTWVTNWLDPDSGPVRAMLFLLMLAGLVLSTSIPDAFGEKGLAFAIAYAAMQVGRSLFTAWSMRRDHPVNHRNFRRMTWWLAFSGGLWIAGGVAEGEVRLGLWIAAIATEYLSPAIGFPVPGLGRSETSDWDVEGGHMAERCGLFLIIALGESILVTGTNFSDMDWTLANATSFLVAFLGSVAMWAVYFNVGSGQASRILAQTRDTGQIARLAYTYDHIIIVAGLVLTAAADEFLLTHPDQPGDTAIAAAVIGGPLLFLTGVTLFKRVTTDRLPRSHVVGLALMLGLVPLALVLPTLALAALSVAVLGVVAIWEQVALGRAPPLEET
ncbi:low temperature requirement protein A [Methylobrevis pamukkalensis]|uniref:Bacterial low temperature requirement A protein (LtrA) n=1 Tax=Methylobrevis pamukkalensis TaxID=1439726 RepID=A0A1E3H8L2_9HYPH|nr:low temperature requirement protein A [Methylobrevis pamukkalensis]ODN72136.1 Bacterial low temperature requirement A protein (LtrA) [Methylobrevis pamukkalensis]